MLDNIHIHSYHMLVGPVGKLAEAKFGGRRVPGIFYSQRHERVVEVVLQRKECKSIGIERVCRRRARPPSVILLVVERDLRADCRMGVGYDMAIGEKQV